MRAKSNDAVKPFFCLFVADAPRRYDIQRQGLNKESRDRLVSSYEDSTIIRGCLTDTYSACLVVFSSMKAWLIPVLLIFASGIVLIEKGYTRPDKCSGLNLEDVESVAASIPIPSLQTAVETAGYKWPGEERLLLFVVGTKTCGSSIVEVEDFGVYVKGEEDLQAAPIVLSLSDSFSDAERYAKVVNLKIPAAYSSEPALLSAFGFSSDRPSRKIAVLIDAQSGDVIRHMHIPSVLTPRKMKKAFLR